MKKKILGIFVSLLVLAIFAIPLNAVLANKPEPITFYGYPLQFQLTCLLMGFMMDVGFFMDMFLETQWELTPA